MRARFDDQHEQRFSYANRADIVEMVTLRLTAVGQLQRPKLALAEADIAGAASGKRRVFVDDQWREIAVWRRPHIGAATSVAGPAIIEEDYTTIYLAPDWTLRRAADGHLAADHAGARA